MERPGAGEHGRGTPCRPFSPPVTSVHLNAISKAICENASVSSEKYRPRRRRMISGDHGGQRQREHTVKISATISLPSAAHASTIATA
jgi:hypothetical protein